MLNIEKQLGNDVKRLQAFNQRFLLQAGQVAPYIVSET